MWQIEINIAGIRIRRQLPVRRHQIRSAALLRRAHRGSSRGGDAA